MSVDPELERWSQSWHRNKAPDVDALIKKTEANRKRMALTVAVELLAGAFAVSQVIRFLNITVEPALRVWGWCLLALLLTSQIVFLAMRRSLWSTQGASVANLLEQSLRHARFGMNYFLINGIAFILVGISLLPFVVEAWQAAASDPVRVKGFLLSTSANGAVLLAGLLLNLWYWMKQRARHREVAMVLKSLDQ